MSSSYFTIISLVLFSFQAHSQFYGTRAQADYGFPLLWKTNGEMQNSVFLPKATISPAIGLEYHWKSGVTLAGSLAFQKDEYHFNERLTPMIPSTIIFDKVYKSFPITLFAGYSKQFGSSEFSAYGSAGIGCGIVTSAQIVDSFNVDGGWQVTDQSGQTFLDTIHVHYSVADEKTRDIELRIETVLGIEYHHGDYFVRTYTGIRLWLMSFSKLQYHSYHSSAHYDFEQTSDGNYSVRPGYFFVGISTGRYF